MTNWESPRPMPRWLETLDEVSFSFAFPLRKVLDGCLYYPASGVDGGPIRCLGHRFQSFVYCDYGVAKEELMVEIERRGFKGYEPILWREVRQEELSNWNSFEGAPLQLRRLITRGPLKDWVKPPYAMWFIFERKPDFSESHGPQRFSLLYLCADGAAAYHALFNTNRLVPGGVAVIQSDGFSGNYTTFSDDRELFYKLLEQNPVGMPEVLLYGGWGSPDNYRQSCWRRYGTLVEEFGQTGGAFAMYLDSQATLRATSPP